MSCNNIGQNIHLTKPCLIAAFLTILLSTSCIEDKVEPLLLGSIQGRVVSKSTGQGLADVEISTAPATTVVFTDAEGNFYIENIPEGEYTIVTKAESFARESIKVSVIRNETTVVNIKIVNSNILAPAPFSPVPANGITNQPLSLSLKWSVDDTHNDSLSYTVRVYEANQITPFLNVQKLRDTTLLVENLKYNTTYYWQVDVMSSTGYVTSGNIWLFKTLPFPDNRIVFTTKRDGNYELYSSDPQGNSLVRITNTSSFELRPMFSNDRERIAFSSNSGIDYHLYIMNKDGSAVRRVTSLPIAGYHNQGIGFTWSPDNGKFIYSHYDKLYRIDNDGANLTPIATAPAGRNWRACDWTASGNKIVAETIGVNIYDSEIYLMDADGSDTVRLVDNLPGIIEYPSFSIDGTEILFTRDASGFESATGRQLDAHIFIINTTTSEVLDLSGNKPDGTNDLQPRFSPDGARIIFVNASNDGTGLKSLWTMSRSGTDRQPLLEDAEMPQWR